MIPVRLLADIVNFAAGGLRGLHDCRGDVIGDAVPDLRDLHEADAACRHLHGIRQGPLHLLQRHQAQPARGFPHRGHTFHQPIHRTQDNRPAVPRSEHVPRAQNRRVETGGADHFLAGGSYFDVRLHHRRGTCHTDVDEVADARELSGGHCGADRDQITERN